MEINTSTWMMIFFILSLVASIWKIWAFLPNKALEDDDRTEASEKELFSLMVKVIKSKKGMLNEKELFSLMKSDKDFDSKRYWRFNQNRLNHLLQEYYIENQETESIKDIYKKNS